MNIVVLAWYITAIIALLAAMMSIITWAPDAARTGAMMTVLFAVAAVLGVFASIALGRVPHEHWIRTSRLLTFCVAAVAATFTVLLTMSMVG